MRYDKRFLGTLAALTLAASTVAPTGTATAAATSALQCRTAVSVFAALPDGSLRLYNHEEPETGIASWSGWSHIGNGWYPHTLIGPNGLLYQIIDGDLFRFRWTGSDWERPGGGWSEKIDTEWTGWDTPAYRKRLTIDSRGDFYSLHSNGVLSWQRYDETTKTWTRRVLEQGNPDRYDLIVAAGDGVFFVRDPGHDNGALYRYKYHPESQRLIQQKHYAGYGWNMHRALFSPGAGIIYGREESSDDKLRWYRYDEVDGTFHGSQQIDWGWRADWQVGAMTDACTLLGAPAPSRPAVPARYDAATTAVPGTDGLMNYFYVNSQGGLVHAKQRRIDDPLLIDYQSFPDHHRFTGTPGAAARADGRLEVLANSSDDADVRGKLQAVKNGPWEAGVKQHAGWLLGDPVMVATANGSAVFGVDDAGALWLRPQTQDLLGYLPWRQLHGTGLTTDITATRNGSAVDIAARFTDGSMRVARFANGTLGPWRTVGDGLGKPTLVVHQDGSLQIFTRRPDGRVHTQRETTGTFPGAWSPVGDLITTGSPAAVVTDRGMVELAARGADNLVHVTGQSTPAGPFRQWTVQDFNDAATDPTALTRTDGTWMITWRDAQNIIYTYNGSYGTASTSDTQANNFLEPDYQGGQARS